MLQTPPTEADRVLALHPFKDQPVRLRGDRYAVAREAILDALRQRGPLTLDALVEATAERIDPGVCTAQWYVRTVKLDLEARGVLARVNSRPHRVRLA